MAPREADRPLRRDNLPIELTSFVGREQALAALGRLLGTARLVTLTGAAGCGKTRLALRAARDHREHFPDGVYWVELAKLADPALLPTTIARALKLTEQPSEPPTEELLEALSDKRLLLVLDNCEHLRGACAALVQAALARTGASVLATSREPLNVAGERRFPVAPLPVPPHAASRDGAPSAAAYDAVRLFVERSRAILPEFTLTAESSEAVADICRRLDGIPLAIEMAAARVNVLTPQQLAARLGDHITLTAPAPTTAHNPHRTLRAAIDWSYDLLTPKEQTLLARLSVFAGGWTLTTAERVCSGDGIERAEVLHLLASLVNRSLITAATLDRTEARYSLLTTIQQYGREKLTSTGQWAAVNDRHLNCFMEVAGEAASKLSGQYQQLWLNWLEEDYGNIRAALRWAVAQDRIEAGLRIAIALYQFWTIRDYSAEGLTWLKRLLARADARVSTATRANALTYAINLSEFCGDRDSQQAFGRDVNALAEALGEGEEDALRWALAAQGFIARKAGDHATAYELMKRTIELNRVSGDAFQMGVALTIASFFALSLRRYNEAHTLLDEGLPLLREAGDPYRIAMALNFAGDLARCEHEYPQAEVAYRESIALLREINAVRDLASALHNMAHTLLHLGDVQGALPLFDESLTIHEEQANRGGMTECLLGYASLANAAEMLSEGGRLLGAAEAIGGRHITSEWAATSMEFEHTREKLRAGLSRQAFDDALAAGAKLTLEAAVSTAREVGRRVRAAQERSRTLAELTRREREVVRLIARARSNGEIAEELVVSKRTVEKHVANIRSKLAFTKRTEIVRWAMENGLGPGSA